MTKIIIEAEINEPLTSEEFERLVDVLQQLGMTEIQIKE